MLGLLTDLWFKIRDYLTDWLNKTGGAGAFALFEIDLTEAHDNEKYTFSGAHLIITDCESQAYVRLNKTTNPQIDLLAVREINSPFNEFYITNAAGAGTLKILAGTTGIFNCNQTQPIDITRCNIGILPMSIDANTIGNIPISLEVNNAGNIPITLEANNAGNIGVTFEANNIGNIPMTIEANNAGNIPVTLEVNNAGNIGVTLEANNITGNIPISLEANNAGNIPVSIEVVNSGDIDVNLNTNSIGDLDININSQDIDRLLIRDHQGGIECSQTATAVNIPYGGATEVTILNHTGIKGAFRYVYFFVNAQTDNGLVTPMLYIDGTVLRPTMSLGGYDSWGYDTSTRPFVKLKYSEDGEIGVMIYFETPVVFDSSVKITAVNTSTSHDVYISANWFYQVIS